MAITPSTNKIPDSKYAREILNRLPDGYRIAYGIDANKGRRPVGKHPILFDPDGNPVRSSGGMYVVVCGTTRNPHSRTADLQDIKRAGVPIRHA